MNYDKILSNILIGNNGRVHKKLVYKAMNLPNISFYIKNRYKNSNSLIESLHRIECYSQEIPKCPICGEDCKYRRYKYPNIIFLKTCGSPQCTVKLRILNSELTSIKKYGCKNAGQSTNAKEKRKKTCLKKYGVEYSSQSDIVKEKIKQTCLERYGVTNGGGSKQALEKIKQTNLKRRGVPYPLLSKECKETAKKTLFDHYGVYTPLASAICKEKMIRTNQEKYGCDYPMSCDWFKEKIRKTCKNKYGVDQVNQFSTDKLWNKYKLNTLNTYGVDHVFKVPEIRNKIYQTNIKKYGVKVYSQTKEYKKYISEHIEEINIKRHKTKTQNNTFNASKPEEELYNYIFKKFPSVKRQYNKDKRYPWCCDFYIPELDLFIELQGTWLHGTHPYNSDSIDDKSIVEEWKKKYNNGEHPLYKSAIYDWSIRDVIKRNKAKENKLNFKEVWSLEEGKKFIDNL